MIGNYDITSFQLKTNLSELSHRSDNDLIVRDSLKHRYKFSKNEFANFNTEELKIVIDEQEVNDLKYKLTGIFDEETPLIYLNKIQRENLIDNIFFVEVQKECTTIYQCIEDTKITRRISFKATMCTNKNTLKRKDSHIIEQAIINPGNEAFILIEGEIHCFDKNNNFIEHLIPGTYFGYEGPIFQKRTASTVAQKGTILAVITQNISIDNILPFSKFATYLQKSIVNKDKFFSPLDDFKNYVLSLINQGSVNIETLLSKYKLINSCLHPKALTQEIDFSAWNYAVERLPEGVFDVFVFNLVNTSTKMITMDKNIFNTYISKVNCTARNRNSFKYLDGKYLIVVRDLETDVLDFISNMCIHLVESIKLRNLFSNPMSFSALSTANDEEAIEALEVVYPFKINDEDKKYISKIFGKDLSSKFIKLSLHYQDYSINIKKKLQNGKDPAEHWIQNIWKNTKKLLGVSSNVDEIDDLVVDIMQGSKNTLLSCINPYLYEHKDEILNWAKENNITYKTKVFIDPNDELVAASYYYFKAFPDKQEERQKCLEDHGITLLEETYSTGVKVLLINVNKLNPKLIDPCLTFTSASSNHLIVYIGYTFGAQSSQIIKPLLLLFGSKARSLNILGKAGALTGNRSDILFAEKVFLDKTHNMIPINYGDVEIEELEEKASCKVHRGPMLCVAGTILQNIDLLRYYKHVNGCVGLEMEGYYYVLEVDRAIKSGVLSKDFMTRCFYYSSDLPLDPNQNLSQEGNNISWDEGIGSMLAIQRFVLQKIFRK